MEFKIISEKQNPVMKRRELVAEIKYNGVTPSKAELQARIAAKLSANPENVEVSKILSEHGKSSGKAWIKIWDEKKVGLYSQKMKGDIGTAGSDAEKKSEPAEEAKAEPAPEKEEEKK